MNINSSNKFSQHNLMSQLFTSMTGKNIGFPDSLKKNSEQYRNRYAATNEVKVNTQGLTGMSLHGKNPSEYRQTVEISDEGKQKIFDMVKKEFIQENGVHNGDTTRRTEVFTDYLRGVPEKDRLKACWTLEGLEAEYWSGFAEAAKQTNPKWEPGKTFDRNVLQNLTMADVTGAVDRQRNKGIDILI